MCVHQRVYGTQRKEIKNLALRARSLKSKGKEKTEINRLQATLEKVEKAIRFAEGIVKKQSKTCAHHEIAGKKSANVKRS